MSLKNKQLRCNLSIFLEHIFVQVQTYFTKLSARNSLWTEAVLTVFAWSASICLNFHSKVTICGRAVNEVTGCWAGSGRPLGPPSLVAKGCNGLGVGLTTLLHLPRGYLWADLYLHAPHTSLWRWPYSHWELSLNLTLSQNNTVIFPKRNKIFKVGHGSLVTIA
jgi:hypothetical protein